MCITIFKSQEEVPYNMNEPLEGQVRGSKKIVIDYEPKDPSIDHFLDEVERLCKNGISANLNIKFNHNNSLNGAKLRKQMDRLTKDLDINELIKIMATTHAETDKKLEEIANHCMGKNCRVKS